MELNEYQVLTGGTAKVVGSEQETILFNAVGAAGEAGELVNKAKKVYWHGHELCRSAFAEEIGDVLWYLAQAASAIGLDLEDIAIMNLMKLQRRYPDGFSSERSINRDETDV